MAGDRVITDLLAKPFSMGKNLLCVNSKKHMVQYMYIFYVRPSIFM